MASGSTGIENSVVLSPEESMLEKETAKRISSLVAELPEKLKIPILLYYSSNLKINEIAECLGESPNTIKTRLRKAKSIMKEELEALGYDR